MNKKVSVIIMIIASLLIITGAALKVMDINVKGIMIIGLITFLFGLIFFIKNQMSSKKV